MILDIAQSLEHKIHKQNRLQFESRQAVPQCELYFIGQTALLESKIGIQMAATMDVDLYKQIHGAARILLQEVLQAYGKQLDPTGHEAWMPKETKFDLIFKGQHVTCFVAQAEYILISKAKKAIEKNRVLLIEYLGHQPSELFLSLAQKYHIDLEEILHA